MEKLIAYIEETKPEIEMKIEMYEEKGYNFSKGENEGRLALLRMLKGKSGERKMNMGIIIEFLGRIHLNAKCYLIEECEEAGIGLNDENKEEDLGKILGTRFAFNCGLMYESDKILKLIKQF